jgi:cytochrome c2
VVPGNKMRLGHRQRSQIDDILAYLRTFQQQ